ncbi:hypothetical protein [Ruegeria sp.]|uniref:hypothetical protein n=1 Tax=Ruegeria sp. TaxID=1879320 RepID=UPI003AFF9170
MIDRRHITRPILALASLLLSPPVLAQSGPLGAHEPASPQAVLGECPVELLRAAWGELDAGTAVAIEQEVLDLCTDRLERIDRLMTLRAQVGAHLAILDPPDPAEAPPASGPAPNDLPNDTPRLAELRRRVEMLEERLARLAESPDNEALRDQLSAAAEAARTRLAEEEQLQARLEAAEAGPPGPSIRARPDPAATPQADPDITAGADPDAATPPAGQNIDSAAPAPDKDRGDPDITAGAEATTAWAVDYVARAAEGPWRAQITGETRFAVTLPGDGPDDPPRIKWQTSRDGPFTVGVGDTLSDGARIHSISSDAVTITEPARPGAPKALDWSRSGDVSAPGTLAWEFTITRIEVNTP